MIIPPQTLALSPNYRMLNSLKSLHIALVIPTGKSKFDTLDAPYPDSY